MVFCPNCKNFMKEKINQGKLYNYCRYCSHEEEVKTSNYRTSYSILKKEEEDIIINPAICYDSTYPQSKTEICIKCKEKYKFQSNLYNSKKLYNIHIFEV